MLLSPKNATSLYRVPAPAKINLFLHVVGQRPDGYHLLQTVFTFLDLYDYLDFEIRADGMIQRVGDNVIGLASEHDLVIKAAKLLQEVTKTRLGANISYIKNIPAGGGMGGGSSNAATTLIALNRLWRTGLNRSQLMDVGLRLGADVPIFIYGQSAFAEGIGDVFKPVSVNPAHYLVVQPNTSIDTKLIFSNKDLTRDQKPVTITDFTDWQNLQQQNNKFNYFGCNNLEPIAIQSDPNVMESKKLLNNLDINSRLTGSGACFFVLVAKSQQAVLLQQKISAKIATRSGDTSRVINKTWICSGLNQHPLQHWVDS